MTPTASNAFMTEREKPAEVSVSPDEKHTEAHVLLRILSDSRERSPPFDQNLLLAR
jgi:hypothetical protein